MQEYYSVIVIFSRLQPELTTVSPNEDGSAQNWNDIAILLPGRTNKDCRKRWSKIQVDIRKGAWTQDEDERLQQAVQQIGVKLVSSPFALVVVQYGSKLECSPRTLCRWSQVATVVRSRNADRK